MTFLTVEIGPAIERKLKNISELAAKKRVKLEGLSSEGQEAIRRYACISNLGASTRIENAVLTDIEIDWIDLTLGDDSRLGSFERQKLLIENKLSKDKERSIEEVAGLRSVLTLIEEQARDFFPLQEATLRGLHKELLQFYPPAEPYRGQYKIASNSVIERTGTRVTREIFRTADPGPITSAAMQQLVAWYNQALPSELWSLAVISEFVYRFLAIHPFQDGNGRLGRALFYLGLLQSPDDNLEFVAPYLAVDRQIEKSRAEYYLVLRQCSGGIFRPDPKEYQIEYFLNFMLKMVERSLRCDIDYYEKKHVNYLRLTESAKKILGCFRDHPGSRLRTGQVVELAKVPRRTVTRTMEELVQIGFLQKLGRGPATHYQLIF